MLTAEKITYDPSVEPKEIAIDSIQERALAYGMLNEKNHSIINYRLDSGGKHLDCLTSKTEFQSLINKFKKDPKDTIAFGRNNILEIVKDRRLTREQKESRVKRYVDAFLDLQIKLDHSAYVPSDEVKQGVPDYVPDGLSDMGSERDVDPRWRGREKIRINKKKIFDQAKQLFYEILSQEYPDAEKFKKYVILKVAHFVYTQMPYNEQQKPMLMANFKSVPLDKIYEDKLAVCRHHALYTQVLLQAFGMTSRLLKCDVDAQKNKNFTGAHAANLVRVDNKWYLLDTTNQDVDKTGKGKIFITPLPEESIDTNNHQYSWTISRMRDQDTWKYKSRNNMYYRIREN